MKLLSIAFPALVYNVQGQDQGQLASPYLNPWSITSACNSPSSSLLFSQLISPWQYFTSKSDEYLKILSTCESPVDINSQKTNEAFLTFLSIISGLGQEEQRAAKIVLPYYLEACKGQYNSEDFLLIVRLMNYVNPDSMLGGNFFTKWFCGFNFALLGMEEEQDIDDEIITQIIESSTVFPFTEAHTEIPTDPIPDSIEVEITEVEEAPWVDIIPDLPEIFKPKSQPFFSNFKFNIPAQALPAGLSCEDQNTKPPQNLIENESTLENFTNKLQNYICTNNIVLSTAASCEIQLSSMMCLENEDDGFTFTLNTEFDLKLLDQEKTIQFYNLLNEQKKSFELLVFIVLHEFEGNTDNVNLEIFEEFYDEFELGESWSTSCSKNDPCNSGHCRTLPISGESTCTCTDKTFGTIDTFFISSSDSSNASSSFCDTISPKNCRFINENTGKCDLCNDNFVLEDDIDSALNGFCRNCEEGFYKLAKGSGREDECVEIENDGHCQLKMTGGSSFINFQTKKCSNGNFKIQFEMEVDSVEDEDGQKGAPCTERLIFTNETQTALQRFYCYNIRAESPMNILSCNMNNQATINCQDTTKMTIKMNLFYNGGKDLFLGDDNSLLENASKNLEEINENIFKNVANVASKVTRNTIGRVDVCKNGAPNCLNWFLMGQKSVDAKKCIDRKKSFD